MPQPLPLEALRKRCDPQDLPFDSTAELEDLAEALGQERGSEAIRFGVKIAREGYNLYVSGPSGIGKHALVESVLKDRAAAAPTPSDWCYVNNFADPQRPKALELPRGRGEGLRHDMQRLLEDLGDVIPATFESDEYRSRAQEINAEIEEQQETEIETLRTRAAEQGIALLRTPTGFAFAPMKDGEVINPKEFERLSSEEKKRIEATVEGLQKELGRVLQHLPQRRRELRERIRSLNEEVATLAVGQRIDELQQAYADCPAVQAYLDAVRQDVIDNADAFRRSEEGQQSLPPGMRPEAAVRERYQINVLVSHSEAGGAPVIYEDHPLYQNLLGRIEHQAMMGALVTDFTLIRPGALHRANGGYLVLEARKLLSEPFAWEGLKRALFSDVIRISSLGEMFSPISTVSLEPEPIPLRVKVVLLGERLIYYLLCDIDPDFWELFKVAADMEEDVERSADNQRLYARLIATLVRRQALKPFSREAVAAVIEQAARLADDGGRLSVHRDELGELLQEADFMAAENEAETVQAAHVQAAIEARRRRHGRIRERLLDTIRRDIQLIDTDGEQVAQVNGLSVLDLGTIRFGQPSRITATARLGAGEVVDIQREVKLGGAIHSKGVLILGAYLGARYVPEQPLSLKASLVFEQSYGLVEGDSASAAELCALLSALAGLPMQQSLAITGSVNQHGRIQAIGGVNEKIEGFFDICSMRGLTGRQGVIIPASNVQHLMLRGEVLDAVGERKFAVYAVGHVDEAMALLTGVAAGDRDEAGNFPEGSVNQRVESRLLELAERRKALAAAARQEENES